MFRTPILLLLLASPVFAQLDPDKGLASMKAGDGLQVELFASEPMVINPTSMDIDPLGRVWVAEAVNYRRKNFNRPILREAGDRIQVLIDTNGDGKADEAKTFYQGKELYGPLSVCVIPTGKGYRVLVAQSPDILEFTCKDATNAVADGPPKKFLTGFGGYDHDHGVHGLHLGPDGKLYFTVGDGGLTGLQSSDGKGKLWKSNTTDVQKGTVWRCDLDGKNLELIAHNFRNNYEACVDSFGEIWLSDNDDDGNQQTRICFVMPGGNYGYGPRGPGQTHWHEEQPGIVHKTLRTGFGSPTGIQFYEGSLLPKQYHNTLMHTDAGPRELRAFTRKPKGAGYELDKANMLTSSDTWFRPSDVCTAPDGSVFVCDWYDPGVGGHGMGDWTRGRVYRITPTGHKGYKVPEVKLETKEGLLAALESPCLSVRAAVNDQLSSKKIGDVVKFVSDTATGEGESNLRSRAIWVMFGQVVHHEHEAPDPAMVAVYRAVGLALGKERTSRMGCFAIRLMDSIKQPLPPPIINLAILLKDTARMREILCFLRNTPMAEMYEAFVNIAHQYDGQDHFLRAALNIACGTDPARRDAILADFEKHFPEWNDKVADLVWELRPKSMLPKMEKLLVDAKLTPAQKARIVDILAASDDASAGKTVLGLLAGDQPAEVKARAIENLKLFLPTKWSVLAKGSELKKAIDELLANQKTTATGLQLAAIANYLPALETIEKMVSNKTVSTPLRVEAVRTLGVLSSPRAVEMLDGVIRRGNEVLQQEAVSAMALQAARKDGQKAIESLQTLLLEETTHPPTKQAILAALAGSRAGTAWLLKLKESGKLPEGFDAAAGRLLRNSPFAGERAKALQIFPPPGKLDVKKLPAFSELAKRTGNADLGKAILAKSATSELQCMKCHVVNGAGGKIGPDLSAIGKKGSKEDLYNSLILPSKAIADQYLSWKVDTDDGLSIVGLLMGETENEMTIRDANGKDYKFPVKGTERKKQLVSLMPEGLVNTLTEDELVDVVEYLFTLRTDVPGTVPMK